MVEDIDARKEHAGPLKQFLGFFSSLSPSVGNRS